jgi:RHS repeat-associated protein
MECAIKDELGAQTTHTYSIQVEDNARNLPPVITSLPETYGATPNIEYSYQVTASDPDGDDLSYQLNNAPDGMSIDAEGRIAWEIPGNLNESFNDIEVVVTDEYGGTAVQPIPLQVNGDAEAPIVEIFQSLSFAYPHQEVTFAVRATDNVGIEDISLTIDGDPVALDASGMVKWSFENVGDYTLIATATDKAGNVSTQNLTFEVVGIPAGNDITLDIQPPSEPISDFTDLQGTVTAVNGLQSYKVEVAPIGSDTFVEVFTQSDNPAEVNNGVLGQFDPTLLANGPYTLRLSAVDNNGATSAIETQIEVAGDLKLGNFQLSFTDLEVPVAGIPITVTRTYDSLSANEQDNFGYGWRLEFRDTNLQTNLEPPTPEEELLGRRSAFRDGTRVYITLPGGKRESFTFDPVPDRMLGIAAGLAGQPASAFRPRFVAEDGSELTLTVDDVLLSYDSATGQYFSANPMGLPYNPEDPRLGGQYTLTTKEGIEYEIDAKTGDLLQVKDLNDNTLTYSDAGIVSSTGKEVKFERDAEGRIKKAIDPQGYEIQYEYDENGDLVKVIDREGNETELFYEAENRPHYLTRIEDPLGRDGIRTEYDPDTGRLSRMLDVNGKAIELTYNTDESTQIVKDIYGEETYYVYDENGNVLTEIQPSGLEIRRTYENNRVKTETLITEESGADGWETVYDYDNQGNLLSETDPDGEVTRYTYGQYGRLLTETDPLGNTTTYTYSPRGNLKSSTDAEGNETQYGYDLRGNLLTLTDANGKVTRFTYDTFGNVKTVTDAEENITEYEYDLNGNRTQETRKNITQPDGTKADIISYWNYDPEGRVTFYTDPERIDPNDLENPNNASTRYTYDPNGNQIQTTDAQGNITESIYDEKGQLVTTIYADETTENTDNPRTITVYDQGGRERAAIDAEGVITHYIYDVAGRLEETIYGDTTTLEIFLTEMDLGTYQPTEYELSQIDWTKVIYPIETPNRVTNLTAPRTKTEYSEDGRVQAEIDEEGNRTEYKYDALGRLEQVIYPDITDNNIDDRSITTYQYDKAGRRSHEIDAQGNITEYQYDKLGRVTKVIFADKTFTETKYDKVGRRVESKDPEGIVTQYEYDNLGRLKAVIQPLNGEEIRTEYFYDEAGRLIEVKDAEQNSTYYEYDKAGRRTVVELPEGQRSITTYDEVGNIKTYTDFNGEVTNYDYDPQNRLELKDLEDDEDVSYTYTDDGQIETITDSRGTTEFKYDELGRLLWRKDPDGAHLPSGNTIEYQYDDAGNIIQVETKAGIIEYEYDEWNRLEEVKEGNETTTYFYDEVGNLERTEFPNGTVETRVYDELHRLQVLEVKDENETVLAKYEYELSDAGYRKQVKETLLQPDGTTVERTIDYDYDELYRLLEAAILGGETVSYAYDDVGNRISSTDAEGTREYVYDENDRLTQELVNGVVVVSYTYDDNGNLKTRTEGGETVNYLWDDQNRLVEVQGSSGIVNYVYDDNNIRVSSTVDDVTTSYLLDKNRPYAQVLAEYIGDDEIASYLYGLDLISQERNDIDSYYLADGLGSTRGLTDENGNVTDVYSYDAYGNLTDSVGSSENDYLFAGEQFDGNLEQYYLRDRYYDPSVGRFTRRDTYEGRLEEPVTLHKYIYANSNPISFIDPSGLASLIDQAAANQIREVISQFYIQVANQAINIAESGGNPQALATQLAWDIGLASFPAVRDRIQKIAKQHFASNNVRASAYREALGLRPFGHRKGGNLAFADIKIVGKEKLTLLAKSGDDINPGLVGIPEFNQRHFKTFETPPGFKRDKDSEFKILEAIAGRYEHNTSIKGQIYLFTERNPCPSCSKVINDFKKMFPNIKIDVRSGQ